ncbi:MAG TPA: alpha-2-macroglobulin family protein, partial [Bacteroidia bacterium]|nr:alpha-2-macroglobulin family protein [Bacteroidia bacterium]
ETPDPHGFSYQKKALGVNAYDVYPFLLPDLALRRSSVGGDAEYSKRMGKRNNPLANKRVKLVAAWSGILKTDGRGEAKYTLDIPQFSGDLRVMACAYKDNAFGSAEHHMKIADPVVISTGLPRFLSPRDTVQMPVTLTNTTKQAQRVTVNLSKSGPLAFAGSTSKEVSLPANGEGRILVPLYA